MNESNDQVTKSDRKVSDGQSAGCSQSLPFGIQSIDAHQSAQIAQEIADIKIKTNNEQDTSNSRQMVRVGNTAAERNRLYRERHREKINRRRRDIRNRKKNYHEIHTLSDAQSTHKIEQITYATSNNQPSSKSHTQRQQRYYEKHKEEINKRKRDSRLRASVPQSVPLTAAERNRNYRERNRQTINERRRDSRLLQQNANETRNKEQQNVSENFNVPQITQPTIPTTPVPSQCHYESSMEWKQSASASSRVSTPLRTQPQYGPGDDFRSLSFQNYTSPEEDHEIFGAFIASELRGLGNYYSLIRSVKRKIQLTILEAYETYEAQSCTDTSTQTDDLTVQQSHPLRCPDEPKIKTEHTDVSENISNEHTNGSQNFNVNETYPTIPITSVPEEIQSQYETNIEMKQSPSASSPVSTIPQTQHQYDFADDSQSVSFQNYTSPEEDHEIFGAFIASELRGLGNNYSLVRSVKKKIQLTILEAYETYQAQNCRQTSTQTDDVALQQPRPPPVRKDEPKIKIEHTDDDDDLNGI